MGCPNFTASASGRLWETRASRKRGRTLPATLARLLMQAHGSSQVSPQSAKTGAEAVVCFAGVAQLVEHLFCKQVVRGSSPRASSGRTAWPVQRLSVRKASESCPSGQREQAVNLPAYAYAGSNPALSTVAGVAQLVERQPSKLNVEGSSPFSRSSLLSHANVTEPHAHLAQLVEHVLGKDEVTSSILVVGSNQK